MTKITNNITELVFILDRSGSMSGLEKDSLLSRLTVWKMQAVCTIAKL